MAAAARGALERSDLFERERRSRQLAQHLALAGRGLAGELDPDNVLDQTARYAVQMLGVDGSSMRVLDGDEVVVRAAAGAGAAAALGTRTPSTAWLVGDIVQTRATRSIADSGGDPRVADADSMLAAGYAGYLGVPMVGPDETAHGILAVYSKRPRAWREEEADALHALAATAAAARTNATLYQGVSHEQQRGEAILANVADGIVAVDREGKVVLWNPAAERVTGVSQAEALGRTPVEALGRPLDAAGAGAGGSRLLPIRRGGEEVWLSLSEAVMTDPAGAVAGRIYAFRDISSERSVEQMKSDFVSTVSHELRTPLTSIYGFAETLLRQDVLFGEEERATFLRYIASESERLTSIVDRLLSVAQLDTGAMAVQLAETDVGAVVNDAVRTAEGADGQNGHRFVVELADEPLSAEADGDKLRQVLAHLLDNAVRYSPAGGTVTVAARRREDAVEVSVEDEGVGIPHAEQERIFRKFYRGDSAASGVVGAGAAGLGLFLAAGLVTAMGGKIRVDSSEGSGRHSCSSSVRPRVRRDASGYALQVTTVLVIDDEAPIRLLCRVNLEAEGMPVLEAEDGPSGLEAARTGDPDVILLDVMMPGLDGWGVAEALLEDESTAEIPIIFLTARAEFRDRAKGLDIGGVDYITKPFNPVELAPLVRSLLDRLERGERDEMRREKLSELRGLMAET